MPKSLLLLLPNYCLMHSPDKKYYFPLQLLFIQTTRRYLYPSSAAFSLNWIASSCFLCAICSSLSCSRPRETLISAPSAQQEHTQWCTVASANNISVNSKTKYICLRKAENTLVHHLLYIISTALFQTFENWKIPTLKNTKNTRQYFSSVWNDDGRFTHLYRTLCFFTQS